MNTTVLNKCVDELKKPEPNISYVLGMIETLIAMSPVSEMDNIARMQRSVFASEVPQDSFNHEKTDEEEIINPVTQVGRIGKITTS